MCVHSSCAQFNFTDTVTYYLVPPNSESCASYSANLVVQLEQVCGGVL